MPIKLIKFGKRDVTIASENDAYDVCFKKKFSILLSSDLLKDTENIEKIIEFLVTHGCKEICCIGIKSEIFHDKIDEILEKYNMLDVVTTWHEDLTEGCEYFLFASGGQVLDLFALISRDANLVSKLAFVAENSA